MRGRCTQVGGDLILEDLTGGAGGLASHGGGGLRTLSGSR